MLCLCLDSISYSSGAPVGGNISVVAVMEALRDEDQRESRGYEMSLDSVSLRNLHLLNVRFRYFRYVCLRYN